MTQVNRWNKYKKCFKDIYSFFMEGVDSLCIWGGIGAGKSIALMQFVHHLCLTHCSIDEQGRKMPLFVLIVGDAYGTLEDGLFQIHKELLLCNMKEDSPFARVRRSGGAIEVTYKNGSRVLYRPLVLPNTKSSASSKIEGLSPNILISDETQKLAPRFMDITVERTRGADILDPQTGFQRPFMKIYAGRPSPDDFYLRRARELANNGIPFAFYYPSTLDMYDWDSQYVKNLRAAHPPHILPVVMQTDPGSTMPSESAIFSMFTPLIYPEGNLVDIKVDYSHPTYLAMDFNVDRPSVLFIQELSVEGRKRSVIVDEWCPDKEVLATELVDFIVSSPYYDAIEEIVCDPAGKARNVAATAGSIVDILRKPIKDGGTGKKVYATHPSGPKKLVEDGVLKVQARIHNSDNERDILVRKELWDKPAFKRGIKHTIQGYRRDEEDRAILTGAKGGQADHIADALRYYIRYRCWDKPLQDQSTTKPYNPDAWKNRQYHDLPGQWRI